MYNCAAFYNFLQSVEINVKPKRMHFSVVLKRTATVLNLPFVLLPHVFILRKASVPSFTEP